MIVLVAREGVNLSLTALKNIEIVDDPVDVRAACLSFQTTVTMRSSTGGEPFR